MTATLKIESLLSDSAKSEGISRNRMTLERQVIAAEAVNDPNAPAMRREVGMPSIFDKRPPSELAEMMERSVRTVRPERGRNVGGYLSEFSKVEVSNV